MSEKDRRKTYPIDIPHNVKFSLFFTEEEFKKLIEGHTPTEMEDKWLIFYEDGYSYFHRSWTGYGIYQTRILRNQDWYFIEEFTAERNKEKNLTVDEDDLYEFFFLICNRLLKVHNRIYIKEQNKRQNKVILEY